MTLSITRSRAAAWCAAVPSLLLAGAAVAEVPCGNFSSSLGQCINTQLTVGGTSYNVDWYLPNATASALMTLQHGFSRGCGNLRNTSKAIMEKGVMVLCLNASVQGGNPALGQALGETLNARNLTPPLGRPLPVNYIVGGHSAGGHFATEVGARLDALGYAALKGAILFDPVASENFTGNLEAIAAAGTRQVLVIAARPSLANLYNNAFGALQQIANPYVGLQLVWSGYFLGIPYGGSCHTDVEGENGDVIGNTAAGCTPDSTQVARLRDFGSSWARDLGTGTRTAAYYCDNAQNKVNCGSKVASLVNGLLPKALLIRTW